MIKIIFFFNKYFKNKKEKKAFFLIEVMLAIFLVLVGFLTVISLASSGLRESMDSRDQIIAGLLAQEGAELVRNIRDNNWVTGGNSFNNLPNNNNDCLVDMNSSEIINGNCTKDFSELQLWYKNNFYTIDPSNPFVATKFHRKIDFDINGNRLTITSMVVWGGSFLTVANCNVSNKCVYVKTILTKWGE